MQAIDIFAICCNFEAIILRAARIHAMHQPKSVEAKPSVIT